MLVYQLEETAESYTKYKTVLIENVLGDFVTDEFFDIQTNHPLYQDLRFYNRLWENSIVLVPNYEVIQDLIDEMVSAFHNKPEKNKTVKVQRLELYKEIRDEVHSGIRDILENNQMKVVGDRIHPFVETTKSNINFVSIRVNICRRIGWYLAHKYEIPLELKSGPSIETQINICAFGTQQNVTLEDVMTGEYLDDTYERSSGIWWKNEDGNKEKIMKHLKEKLDFS